MGLLCENTIYCAAFAHLELYSREMCPLHPHSVLNFFDSRPLSIHMWCSCALVFVLFYDCLVTAEPLTLSSSF